jgi:hypothetical protein
MAEFSTFPAIAPPGWGQNADSKYCNGNQNFDQRETAVAGFIFYGELLMVKHAGVSCIPDINF